MLVPPQPGQSYPSLRTGITPQVWFALQLKQITHMWAAVDFVNGSGFHLPVDKAHMETEQSQTARIWLFSNAGQPLLTVKHYLCLILLKTGDFGIIAMLCTGQGFEIQLWKPMAQKPKGHSGVP